jgi:hypothetical protein
MSQQARDERLGLTGLSPEQRARRIEELAGRHARLVREARAALRAARRAGRTGPNDG